MSDPEIKRYKIWTQLEPIDEDGEPLPALDQYVSVTTVDTLEEAKEIQNNIQAYYE